MTTEKLACPPQSVLGDYVHEKLDPAAAGEVRGHLAHCADCRQRVSSISSARPAKAKRDRTYVPGESLANFSSSTDGSLSREDGLARPSAKLDGLGSPSSFTAPPELTNEPGYELLKELGQGGMGTVYLARNREMDRPEVLKVVSKELLARPGARERFQQEIRSAAKLQHPNIVAAYSVLRPGDLLVFAMEYVRGQDLAQVVRQRGPLPVANAAYYIQQVALGLQHAHEKGMVHRDIKPNNLMLAIEGKKHIVKILDFGLAKATSEKDSESGLTKSGQMLGTPDYVAPEQTLDAHKADIRADIYSLGCTLYFLLSGGPPFQEASLFEILQAHHTRDARPLNLVCPEVPAELAAVAAKMMAKKPEDRYQTPGEVAKALVPFFKPGQAAVKSAHDSSQSQFGGETPHGLGSVAPPPITPFPAPIAEASAGAAADLLGQFSVSVDTLRPTVTHRRRGWSSLPPWQRWAALGSAALALLLGIVLLVRTPRGTIEIELSDREAHVTVAVDGNRIDIAGLDEPLSLEVGEHDINVKGAGYETLSRRFQVTRGKNARLAIKLVRSELQAPEPEIVGKELTAEEDPDRRAAEYALSLGGKIRINGLPEQWGDWLTSASALPRGTFRLTSVDLEGNKRVTEAGLKAFRGTKHLYELAVKGCTGISDVSLANFKENAELAALNLQDARISATGLRHFNGCASLRWLYLGGSIKDEDISFLKEFSWLGNLLDLYLEGTKVTDDGLRVLEKHQKLYGLRLANTTIGDAGLAHLRECRALRRIWLEHTRVTAAGVKELKRALPECTISWDGGDVTLAGQPAAAAAKADVPPNSSAGREPSPNDGPAPTDKHPLAAPPPLVTPLAEEAAQKCQRDWAEHLQIPVRQTNSIGMSFVLVPPGDFALDPPPKAGDTRVRRVTRIDRAFYLAAHEVTQEAYREVTQTNPSFFATGAAGAARLTGSSDRQPVEQVSWRQAVEFCNALSRMEKLPAYYDSNGNTVRGLDNSGYRLPSIAEWNCAASGGGDWEWERTPATWPEFAWSLANSAEMTWPVASKRPNSFGLFDMYGNVWEWCAEPGSFCGHAYSQAPDFAIRRTYTNNTNYRWRDLGFRVARTPEAGERVLQGKPKEAPAAQFSDATAPGEFVPLFNGKDLTGWKTHPSQPGNWRVENGILIGSGPKVSHLFSERGDYTNFDLRIEARINDGGDGGVNYRATFGPTWPASTPLWPDGYEVQIGGNASGWKTGSIFKGASRVRTVAVSQTSPNEWFSLELMALDKNVAVKVNGQMPLIQYTDPERLFPMGHIALQQGDANTVIEFRKIEIKEHSPVSAPRPEAANAAPLIAPASAANLTAAEAFTLKHHTGAVTRVMFHRALPVLASAGKDGLVLLWNLDNRTKQTELQKYNEEAWAVKFRPDGEFIAYSNRHWWGSRLFFKTLAGVQVGQPIKDFKWGGGAVASIAYSPDAELFAAGQDNGAIRLWHLPRNKELNPIGLGDGHNVYNLAFGPVKTDRKRKRTEYVLAAAGQDGRVRTFVAAQTITKNDLQWTFQQTGVQFPKSRPVIGLRYGRDGKLLGYTRTDGEICLANSQTGETVRALAQSGGGSVEWIAFHPQRPWCITAHKNDQVARIWNIDNGEMLCELRGHTGGVMCAEFSPDGRRVATASEDFSIKVWDLSGPDVPAVPKGTKKAKLPPLVVGE